MLLNNEENTIYIRELRAKLFDCRCDVGTLECKDGLTDDEEYDLNEVWNSIYNAMHVLGDIIGDTEYN